MLVSGGDVDFRGEYQQKLAGIVSRWLAASDVSQWGYNLAS